MDETGGWTNLSINEIVNALREEHSVKVSRGVVRKLLKKHDYRLCSAQKRLTKKNVPNRDRGFKNINSLISTYKAAGNPVMSFDTKKKEYLGNLYREGKLYTRGEIQTLDHDFRSYAEGVIIPHCFYDLERNEGYIQLGTSHAACETACDSFRHWWYNYGRYHYPDATSILLLCDGGGSNSSRHYIFKSDLQKLVDEIQVEIRIAHYPPYCSKYNPIEHRFFPHVTRACRGVVFTSIELVKELMVKTKTRDWFRWMGNKWLRRMSDHFALILTSNRPKITQLCVHSPYFRRLTACFVSIPLNGTSPKTKMGLKTFVHIIDKVYQTGRKVADDFKENMRIIFDDFLPRWNYRAIPQSEANGKVI